MDNEGKDLNKEKFDGFMALLKKISISLQEKEHKGLVNDSYLQDFQVRFKKLEESSANILAENRNLKIGIVGQVKAGKSSFLNALLFDGQDILPHAATPMTAALTRIVYSNEPYAKVTYYGRKDWDDILKNADTYETVIRESLNKWESEQRRKNEENKGRIHATVQKGIKEIGHSLDLTGEHAEARQREENKIKSLMPERLSACKEVFDLAKVHGIDPDRFLGTEENVVINEQNIQNDLSEYVGVDGRYTPFVKYIELGMNQSALSGGIEIIDTPGMDDPIVSRGLQTKNFLMNCDIVFILTPSSEFLDSNDLKLIANTLPADNIRQAVLLGSKVDDAFLENSSRKRISLREVIGITVSKLTRDAERKIDSYLRMEGASSQGTALKNLKGRKPKFVSSILHSAARKKQMGLPLSGLENQVVNNLMNRFDGMSDEPNFLRELANIDRLRNEEFTEVKQRKEEIIAERQEELLSSQQLAFLKHLNEMQAEAEGNLETIKTGDIDSLTHRLEMSRRALISMRRQIATIFEGCAIDSHRYLVKLSNDLKAEAKSFMDIRVENKTKTEHHVIEHWFSKDEHWDEIIHYTVASVNDAVANVRNYTNAIEQALDRELLHAIDVHKIQNEVKAAVLSAFQLADTDFNENDIIGPVGNVLNSITIPEFNVIDERRYTSIIEEQFSGSVRDEDIHELVKVQNRVLAEIQKEIGEKLKEKSKSIEAMLNERAANFTDDVKKQIEEKITILQKNLTDREGSIKNYSVFLQVIGELKDELRHYA